MKRKKKILPAYLSASQDGVMADYAVSGALRKKKDVKGKLHMFFSPHRLPIGMTDEEVAICVLLHHFIQLERNRDIEQGLKRFEKGKPGVFEFFAKSYLPEEFRPGKVMTRTRFKQGLYKLLLRLSMDL